MVRKKVLICCFGNHADVDMKFFVGAGARIADEDIAACKLMKGAGCKTCNGSGYKGRVALYEVMRLNDAMKEMILQGASTAELKIVAIKNGMSTLRMSGNLKIMQGMTTPEEIMRVTMAD